jgi:hypothetical protein
MAQVTAMPSACTPRDTPRRTAPDAPVQPGPQDETMSVVAYLLQGQRLHWLPWVSEGGG